jgi:hypothetical protein
MLSIGDLAVAGFILDDDDDVLNLGTKLGHLTDHPTRRFSAPFYRLCGVLFFCISIYYNNYVFKT